MLRALILLMIGPLGWIILALEARQEERDRDHQKRTDQPTQDDWTMNHDDRR